MDFPRLLILLALGLPSSSLSATPFLDLSLPSDTYREMRIPDFENRQLEERSAKHHIHVSYPQTGYPLLNEVISEFVADEINTFKSFQYAGDEPNHPHKLSITFKAPTQTKTVISLIAGVSKRTSGASPNYDLEVFNFSTTEDRIIQQDEILEATRMNEGDLKAEIIDAISKDPIYGEWESVHESIRNHSLPPFSIEVDGVRFWYGTYEIAPGAFGIIDVLIPNTENRPAEVPALKPPFQKGDSTRTSKY